MSHAPASIYISGVHSGPSPTAGIGIARCLRLAFPGFRLIAVDDSPLSSGLSWPDFDEVHCVQGWDSLDLPRHAQAVRDLVGRGGVWLATRDREVHWIASALADVRGIPNPPASALKVVAKPAEEAAAILGLAAPPWSTLDDEYDLHSFCRRSGWDIWVKGLEGEAIRIATWSELHAAATKLAATEGGRQGLFVQRHVEGRGEVVAFCARSGELLGAVSCVKRVVTEAGKIWTGDVTPLPADFDTALRRFVAQTNWTGGGELEMICDPFGRLWLIEVNPRFPAWIYGAALAGTNLPARLVAAELGIEPPTETATRRSFTRVVMEVPIRTEVGKLKSGGKP